jgi:NAD(P)-dependent dehydrogenase (short-subunit alcohol dehydrogenase family)
VLINNACQTVRRPPAYYSHLIEKEETYHAIAAAASMATPLKSLPYQAPAPSATHQGEEMEEMASTSSSPPHSTPSMTIPPSIPILLEKQNQFLSAYSSHQAAQAHRDQELIANSSSSSAPSSALSVAPVPVSSASLHNISSAQMSQLTFLPEEKSDHLNPATLQLLFPVGHRDVNNQQIDLRNHNSWTMKLDEVPTVELAEVFAINTIAPTILNARLKPLMKRTKPLPVVPPVAVAASGGAGAGVSWKMNWKFVVNVSAMEGKFYRYKSSNHPHTNMAKAALNMMTRTSAQDYRQDNIFMTAVDTGWINDEKPIEKAMKHEEKHDFQTPLDEIDAASRVLDPVIGPLRALQDFFQQQETTDAVPPKGMEPPWGHFIKDYMKSEW